MRQSVFFFNIRFSYFFFSTTVFPRACQTFLRQKNKIGKMNIELKYLQSPVNNNHTTTSITFKIACSILYITYLLIPSLKVHLHLLLDLLVRNSTLTLSSKETLAFCSKYNTQSTLIILWRTLLGLMVNKVFLFVLILIREFYSHCVSPNFLMSSL